MDVLDHNRRAWNRYVDLENPWIKPVSREQVERAWAGEGEIAPTRPAPVVPLAVAKRRARVPWVVAIAACVAAFARLSFARASACA